MRVNEVIVVGDTKFTVSEITLEGMPVFAIIEIDSGGVAYIRGTMMSERGALLQLSKITKKLLEFRRTSKIYQSYTQEDMV